MSFWFCQRINLISSKCSSMISSWRCTEYLLLNEKNVCRIVLLHHKRHLKFLWIQLWTQHHYDYYPIKLSLKMCFKRWHSFSQYPMKTDEYSVLKQTQLNSFNRFIRWLVKIFRYKNLENCRFHSNCNFNDRYASDLMSGWASFALNNKFTFVNHGTAGTVSEARRHIFIKIASIWGMLKIVAPGISKLLYTLYFKTSGTGILNQYLLYHNDLSLIYRYSCTSQVLVDSYLLLFLIASLI